jgi:integrase
VQAGAYDMLRAEIRSFKRICLGIAKTAKYIRKRLGKERLRDLTRPMCQKLINELEDRGLTGVPPQVRNVINCMFKHAIHEEDWGVKYNPLREEPLRVNPLPKRPTPSMADMKLLLETVLNRHPGESYENQLKRICLIYAAATMGICKGELCGLQIEHVMFGPTPGTGVMKIRHNYSQQDGLKKPKKEARNRDVAMNPFVEKTMWSYIEQRGFPKTGFFFVGNTGKPLLPEEVYHSYFCTPMRRAGLMKPGRKPGSHGVPKFTFHDSRHVAATLMVQKGGMNVIQVRDALGHSNASTTLNVYADVFRDADNSREGLHTAAEAICPPTAMQPLAISADPRTKKRILKRRLSARHLIEPVDSQ